jgi:hypothetical protein
MGESVMRCICSKSPHFSQRYSYIGMVHDRV